MKRDLRVLITGCGSEGAYGVIRGLRANEERNLCIVGLDTDPFTVSRYKVDQFHIPPRRHSPEFFHFVEEIVQRESIDVIYPIPTAELELFATRMNQFHVKGKSVIVSSPDSLRTAIHKGRLFRWMENIGFSCTPSYRIVSAWNEFISAVHGLGYPTNPVCFKPSFSTGSQGFRVLDAKIDRLHLLMNAHPTSIFTSLEELALVLGSASPFPELIVMEYLPGDEYDVDVLAHNGHCLCVIPRRNQKMWYGMSLICVAEFHPGLMETAERIVSSLGLSYVISLSFKRNEAGQEKLIEINPRIPGSIICSLATGVNMPYLAIKLALGEDVTIPKVEWGTQMIRYWDEIFVLPDGQPRRF
jgi:carbamoyl-phosphate synthase large subunit